MKKIIVLILLLISCIGILVLTIIGINKCGMNNFSIDSTKLYNATNTYSYNSNYEENGARYNLEKGKTSKIVGSGGPLMTVFTHGFEAGAIQWSNDGSKFAYSKDSLITQFAKIIDSNIYWVKFNTDTEFKIYNITNEVYAGINTGNIVSYENCNEEIKKIQDISKHTVIIFEAGKNQIDGKNDAVYTQFNYAISKIVYDISKLNSKMLPTMNLIGYSRGGITNLQYALDHPELVNSMYSIGTPYFGINIDLLDVLFFKNKSLKKDVIDDIANQDVYTKYMNRWNEKFKELYSRINALALGGYTTIETIGESLMTEKNLDFIQSETGVDKATAKEAIQNTFNALNSYIGGKASSDINSKNKTILIKIKDEFSKLSVKLNQDQTKLDSFAEILFNDMIYDHNKNKVLINSDCLVKLSSQLGCEEKNSPNEKTYKEFRNESMEITTDALSSNNLLSSSALMVHNLELNDCGVCSLIVSRISLLQFGINLNGEYDFSVNMDGTVSINAYIGETNSSTLTIPSYIEGRKVTYISDGAFSKKMNLNPCITTIVIPSTVKEIGKQAFYNNENITNIIFEENSKLNSIESEAFSKMSSLHHLAISEHVNYIGENAFKDTEITSFIINNNPNYSWENGVLINKNVISDKYIAIYVDPTLDTIVMPSSVKIITASLFENNKNIITVDLNNVEFISTKAFKNSSLTYLIGIENVKDISNDAFYGTAYLENQKG